MKEADVALTPIPQADDRIKNRPVIILRELPKYNDFLVCGVSTQLNQYVKDFDEIIATTDLDYKSSGLIAASVIRLGFLAFCHVIELQVRLEKFHLNVINAY